MGRSSTNPVYRPQAAARAHKRPVTCCDEFARPAPDKYIVIGCAPAGFILPTFCHLFIPIVKYVTFGIASISALFSRL